jgi:hypothetical protein
VATHWPQQEFIATGQLNYTIQAAVALAIKGFLVCLLPHGSRVLLRRLWSAWQPGLT